jgi:DNA modification methylase
VLIMADARHLPLVDGCVNCCVTSPPYWGLRDYGTARWEGGDSACDHRHPAEQRQLPHGDGRVNDSYADSRVMTKPGVGAVYKDACGKCGAHRIDSQLGLEPTPDAYVANLVQVFREVRRVLRDDGTVWLNLGDSYYNCSPVRKSSAGAFEKVWDASNGRRVGGSRRYPDKDDGSGLKMKDLVGIPWRVAFALQADGCICGAM